MATEDTASPILDLLADMNLAGIEASSLDAETLMLVMIAIAAQPAVDELDLVRSVVAAHGGAERIELEPLGLLRIAA